MPFMMDFSEYEHQSDECSLWIANLLADVIVVEMILFFVLAPFSSSKSVSFLLKDVLEYQNKHIRLWY